MDGSVASHSSGGSMTRRRVFVSSSGMVAVLATLKTCTALRQTVTVSVEALEHGPATAAGGQVQIGIPEQVNIMASCTMGFFSC